MGSSHGGGLSVGLGAREIDEDSSAICFVVAGLIVLLFV
jgi:hypothetical protein